MVSNKMQFFYKNNAKLSKKCTCFKHISIFRNKYILGFAGGSKSHKELFRYYGMLEERVFLMPMMVDNTKFYCDTQVFSKPFTFLYVGRIIKHKNVEALIQQFNANFHNKNAILKIVGSKYYDPRGKNLSLMINKINGKFFYKDTLSGCVIEKISNSVKIYPEIIKKR